MRLPVAIVAVLGLMTSYAHADGDLTVTLEWTAQKPSWRTTTTEPGLVKAALLDLWQKLSAPNGLACTGLFSLAKLADGQGGCLRNLYNTGNVCKLDPSPTITVNSISGGVVASATLKNNYAKLTYSLLSGPLDICGITQNVDGDPQFNVTASGTANIALSFTNGQLNVTSATLSLSHADLGGANNSGGFLIMAANLAGAFDQLKGILEKPIDVTNSANSELASSNINKDIAEAFKPLQGIPVTSSLTADDNGVHVVVDGTECLPGQTLETFPCDGTKVCLNQANWTKINTAHTSCASSYFGHGVLSCQGFPGPSGRGPLPPDGWFSHGTTTCVAPSAAKAKAILTSAENALSTCQNQWDLACLAQIPGCQQFVAPSTTGGEHCDPKNVPATGPCSAAALAAATEANANNPKLKACQASQDTATTKCQSQVTTASASTCASQIAALNQAKQLCSEVSCGSN